MAVDLEKLLPYTKSSLRRLTGMADAIKYVDHEKIEGDIVECGVWRGGNLILARKLSPKRTCWLYDTFEGMPPPGEHDKKKSGATAMESYQHKVSIGHKWAAVSVEEVLENFREHGLDDSRLVFVVGMVEDTLRFVDNLPDKIAVLRLDTDWYSSTKIELEVLYPRLVNRGVLIVDDYGHWLGSKKAVDEYFGERISTMTWIDYTAVKMVKP